VGNEEERRIIQTPDRKGRQESQEGEKSPRWGKGSVIRTLEAKVEGERRVGLKGGEGWASLCHLNY